MKKYGLSWEQLTDKFSRTDLTPSEFERFTAKKGYKVHDNCNSGFISTKGEFMNILYKRQYGHMNAEYYELTLG